MSDPMRKYPKSISHDQKDQLLRIKELGNRLWEEYQRANNLDELDARAMAVARTHLETSVMWAAKAVTA